MVEAVSVVVTVAVALAVAVAGEVDGILDGVVAAGVAVAVDMAVDMARDMAVVVCGRGRDCERFICNCYICFDVAISLVQNAQHVIINHYKMNTTNNKTCIEMVPLKCNEQRICKIWTIT